MNPDYPRQRPEAALVVAKGLTQAARSSGEVVRVPEAFAGLSPGASSSGDTAPSTRMNI